MDAGGDLPLALPRYGQDVPDPGHATTFCGIPGGTLTHHEVQGVRTGLGGGIEYGPPGNTYRDVHPIAFAQRQSAPFE